MSHNIINRILPADQIAALNAVRLGEGDIPEKIANILIKKGYVYYIGGILFISKSGRNAYLTLANPNL
jgi:hypothetical protein